MSSPLIRTFSYHYRQKFGFGVGKLPIDMGQPCPNRKNGGCVFCRPAGFTPSYLSGKDDVANQLAKGKKAFLAGRFKKYFGYFQQESCTSVDPEKLLSALDMVLADSDCVGVILSTRPDCIEKSLLTSIAALIKSTQKECLFELGLQSIHQKSLEYLNRNHTYSCFLDAVKLIHSFSGMEVGAHLIFGIPGESEDDMIATVKAVCGLGVQSLKLHHLQVLQGTPLQELYDRGEVTTYSREQYQELLLTILSIIPQDMIIHRLWATSHPNLLVAPRWNCLAGTLSVELREQMMKRKISQGCLSTKAVSVC